MPRLGYNPCSYLPRRLQIVSSITITVLLLILFFGSSPERTEQARAGLSEGARRAANLVPDNVSRHLSDSVLNPFRVPAHRPPADQANSTSGDVTWFSDLKWRNPFSHAISHDDRAVLPRQARRVPIYTYYDYSLKRDPSEKAAEHDLILTWRKAWWAKGFRPVVLGQPEAKRNPHFKSIRGLRLAEKLEGDVMRWLAWGNMGDGILSNYLALPMCDYNDPMMKFLRKGEFPSLSRYKNLGNGFFVGEKLEINNAVKKAITRLDGAAKVDSIMELLPQETFRMDLNDDAIGFYWIDVLEKKFFKIWEQLALDSVRAKVQLRKLIEAHLQLIWQNKFTNGIAILQPIPDSMSAAIAPARGIATNLTACLESPFPATCPPNKKDCKPCLPSHPLPVETLKVHRNDSALFTIGTVPHPYTMANLIKRQLIETVRLVRRSTSRDPYIIAATKEALGTGRSGPDRILYMKDAVAGSSTTQSGLWMTAERTFDAAFLEDLSWTLGFPIPSGKLNDGKSETPVPGPERRIKDKAGEDKKRKWEAVTMPDEKGVAREKVLIADSKAVLKKREAKGNKRLIAAVEGWNMADAEVWGFVRAWNARRRVEREVWEDEERGFAGGEGGKGWGRLWNAREEDGEV